MVKVYTPRRLRERNRWLRSDGRPSFKSEIHERPPELEAIMIKDPPRVTEVSTILNTCEVMSSSGIRLVLVTDPASKLTGVVSGMDIIDYLGGGSKYKILSAHNISNIYEALNLHVRSIMSLKPLVADISSKLSNVLEMMVSYGIGALPVVKDGNAVGLITEGGIVKRLAGKPTGIRVRDVMTSEVITTKDDIPLGTAMKQMVNAGIRRIPLVNKEGVITRVLTWKDIIDFIGKHEVFNKLRDFSISGVHSLPVGNVARPGIMTVEEDLDISIAAERMLNEGVDYALVTKSESGEVVGIITERDILYGIVVG